MYRVTILSNVVTCDTAKEVIALIGFGLQLGLKQKRLPRLRFNEVEMEHGARYNAILDALTPEPQPLRDVLQKLNLHPQQGGGFVSAVRALARKNGVDPSEIVVSTHGGAGRDRDFLLVASVPHRPMPGEA